MLQQKKRAGLGFGSSHDSEILCIYLVASYVAMPWQTVNKASLLGIIHKGFAATAMWLVSV